VNLFGFEIIKINFFLKGLFFSVILITALHFGVRLSLDAFASLKGKRGKPVFFALLYVAAAATIFYMFVQGNFFYRVLSYILVALYTLILLSRGFVNWYSRSEEISRKMDRIIELLERQQSDRN